MSSYQLDARNLLCPMPVIRTQNRVAELEVGDELEILCTDPGALTDIPTWCRIEGHEILELVENGNTLTIRLRVAPKRVFD
ncbi:MAG: SirA family protein [Acidiferrobacteraceae bacterium]|nr:SirA family protein [Acidiferrobacteraceae bacterium]